MGGNIHGDHINSSAKLAVCVNINSSVKIEMRSEDTLKEILQGRM